MLAYYTAGSEWRSSRFEQNSAPWRPVWTQNRVSPKKMLCLGGLTLTMCCYKVALFWISEIGQEDSRKPRESAHKLACSYMNMGMIFVYYNKPILIMPSICSSSSSFASIPFQKLCPNTWTISTKMFLHILQNTHNWLVHYKTKENVKNSANVRCWSFSPSSGMILTPCNTALWLKNPPKTFLGIIYPAIPYVMSELLH